MMKQMNKKERGSGYWKRLKAWMKMRLKISCSNTDLTTQESEPFYVDGQFWEAENDIIKSDDRVRRLRTD